VLSGLSSACIDILVVLQFLRLGVPAAYTNHSMFATQQACGSNILMIAATSPTAATTIISSRNQGRA
jgi:hypothetical protein